MIRRKEEEKKEKLKHTKYGTVKRCFHIANGSLKSTFIFRYSDAKMLSLGSNSSVACCVHENINAMNQPS